MPVATRARHSNGLGGFVGVGYEFWRNSAMGIGAALAYHAVVEEFALEGGNLGDYYSQSLTSSA